MFESSNLKSKLNESEEAKNEEAGPISYNFLVGAKEMIILGPFNILFSLNMFLKVEFGRSDRHF